MPVDTSLGYKGNRRSRTTTAPRRPEKALQQQARASLSHLGYQCLETGVPRRKSQHKCPKCQHEWTGHASGGNQNAPGVPDLLAFRYSEGFPSAVFVGIEMKGEDTPVSEEQQRLSDEGRIVLAYSVQDAIDAVHEAELAMHDYRFDGDHQQRILEYLHMNRGRLT
jgi:hypothetical protein